jgi:hypothetical protein
LEFGFWRWPFEISAGGESEVEWAGRPALREQIDRIARGLKPDRPTSLINVWAAFGAGKTFAMRYAEKQAQKMGIIPIYVVISGAASGFSSIYRSVMQGLQSRSEAFEIIATNVETVRTDVGQSIYQASRRMTIGNAAQAAEAFSYLSGAKTSLARRRDLGVTAELSDANISATALALVLSSLGRTLGVLLLLDEMQDLANMKPRGLAETTSSLQKVFDEVQHGLRIVTSFTTYGKGQMEDILGQALTSRSSRMLEIPELQELEGIEFLKDLIRQAKVADQRHSVAPFTEESLQNIVGTARQNLRSGERLGPREIIKEANNRLEDLM